MTLCHICPKHLLLLIFLSCVIFLIFYVKWQILPEHATDEPNMQQAVYRTYNKSAWSRKMINHSWSCQTLVDCKQIVNGNQTEISRAIETASNHPKTFVTPQEYINFSKSCNKFIKRRGYILQALDEQEEAFPIAFSITIYKDIEQFERLLRAIYRPQNYYCIHIDKKSPDVFLHAVQSISDCFENVFIASSSVDVKWGEFTVLQADLICMEDLWRHYKKWKYFINLTGQEFPLRTNNEIVEILQSYNETADIITQTLYTKAVRHIQERIEYKWHGSEQTKEKLGRPPYNLKLSKGSVHVALPRSFVDYILQSWIAKDFLEWLKNTYIPDETYIVTLNNSPDLMIPGSYTGRRPSYIRYKNWKPGEPMPCRGKIVRWICINGVGDVQTLTKSPHLFVNKLHLDFQHFTLDCLEEWIYNRTRAYYQGDLVFDVTPYIYHEKKN